MGPSIAGAWPPQDSHSDEGGLNACGAVVTGSLPVSPRLITCLLPVQLLLASLKDFTTLLLEREGGRVREEEVTAVGDLAITL